MQKTGWRVEQGFLPQPEKVAHVQMLPHIAETPGSICGYALSSPPLGDSWGDDP